VGSKLDALIVRMLSDEPQARGSAATMAQALERAASRSSRKVDALIVPSAQDNKPWGSLRYSRALGVGGLAAAVGCLLLALCVWWTTRHAGQGSRGVEDGGVVALGDSGPLTAGTPAHRAPPTGLRLDMPKKPLPGQQLPPCYEGFEVEIELTEGNKDTRSCWLKVDAQAGKCKVKGYEYKGGCYVPVYPPFQIPQSAKP
jgi:hypothetical protein